MAPGDLVPTTSVAAGRRGTGQRHNVRRPAHLRPAGPPPPGIAAEAYDRVARPSTIGVVVDRLA
ncbi:MAG TPA: hypothetical protein VM618_05025 [Acidimicrobiia bacterium]|nr:hypothetical protein [Acidimicrobiia bacterium]